MPAPTLQQGIDRAGSAVNVPWKRGAGHPGRTRLGEHPGGDVDPEADLGFKRIRATVQPSPYNEYARTKYRAEAATA